MELRQKVLTGVVGCGYWGKNLIRNFYELGSLAAICDSDPQSLNEMKEKYSVPRYAELDAMLALRELQAVVIAAPAAQHYAIAKKALLAGKDVFVEKPLALHVQEGEELVELAKKQSRILMVGHLLHYHPAITELKRLVQCGELGRVEY